MNVVNKIEVKPRLYSGDVRQAITAALERHMERQSSHIGIAVDDGTVTLTGTVSNRAEKDAIVGATRATPGVHGLVDQIRIDLRTH